MPDQEVQATAYLNKAVRTFRCPIDTEPFSLGYLLNPINPPKQGFFTKLFRRYKHIGTWFWDRANDILYWDKEMQRIYGITPSDTPIDTNYLIGTYNSLFNLYIHPEDQERVLLEVCYARDRHLEFHSDFRIFKTDKSLAYVSASGRWLYLEDGTPVAMVGCNWLVTPRFKKLKDIELLLRQHTCCGKAISNE